MLGQKKSPMFTLDLDKLTSEQRSMVALWEAHLKAEMQDKDAHASCDTMVANPCVNHVAVLTGGVGRRQLNQRVATVAATQRLSEGVNNRPLRPGSETGARRNTNSGREL
jgi:hypothetical protein